MTLDDAIAQACVRVGIMPPRGRIEMRKWIKADTGTKNGKGDGRLICDEARVTAMNWQTGESATVWLNERRSAEDKRRYAQQQAVDRKEAYQRSRRAVATALRIINAATADVHPYLARKGFPEERPLVIGAEAVVDIAGDYLVPKIGRSASAIVVPARIGGWVSSVQLIWPDGTKKFIYGGEISGACHRVAAGADTWLCEGFATALTLRAALRGLNRRDTVLVCFSAANIVKVAEQVKGRSYIVADHDAPPKAKPDQFGGLGAGEYFARKAGSRYLLPPDVGTDINDLHQAAGIFAVQRLITGLLRGVPP